MLPLATDSAFSDAFLLTDWNARWVTLGVVALGVLGGVVGSFLVLRKRALLADAVSHATLPGVAGGFLLLTAFGQPRALPVLLLGAATTGLAGAFSVSWLKKHTKLKDDAATACVLGVFYGLGAALLGMVADLPGSGQAGLERFIYGQAAAMKMGEALTLLGLALPMLLGALLFFKELRLASFDPGFAAAQGWPVAKIDAVLMALATGVVVLGLPAVGLILVVAMLLIPAAAARFWTDRLGVMVALAGAFGGLAGYFGAAFSGLSENLPTGPTTVLCASTLFGVGLLFSPKRGLLAVWTRRLRMEKRVARQHLLRAAFELAHGSLHPLAKADLLTARSWSARSLEAQLARAAKDGLLTLAPDTVALTAAGLSEAARLTRNHRLWELYLITHADIAPSHVDRDADEIEHVLSPAMIAELETLLAAPAMPASAHR